MSACEACQTRPAAKADYTPRGEYIEIDGRKIYRVGSSTASKAIFAIYDIYAFAPQTLQGCDILAELGTSKEEFQVFLPDFLDGKLPKAEWFSPNATPEHNKEKGEYFAGIGSPGRAVASTPQLVSALSQKYPSIKSWGALGYCWGAKVVSLTSGQGTPFKAGAEVHPTFLDPKDAENITIPICMLASKDEDAETVKAFVANLKGEKYFETFSDQVHGWMGARGDLNNERNKAEYERGYGIVLDFFKKNV